jgi:hypothetical protein
VQKPKAGLPVIPGYNIIGMGLDAATMDFTVLPVVSLVTTENNTYNCNSNNQYGPGCWQNPFYPDYKFFVSLHRVIIEFISILDSLEYLP